MVSEPKPKSKKVMDTPPRTPPELKTEEASISSHVKSRSMAYLNETPKSINKKYFEF